LSNLENGYAHGFSRYLLSYLNGSYVVVKLDGAEVRIEYVAPRNGMVRVNVTEGTRLFTGGMDKRTGRVMGTAYVFSAKCGAQPYQVSGRISSDENTLILSGAAPTLDTACRVVEYSTKSSNAQLLFVRATVME
jgi:hypothetical protein